MLSDNDFIWNVLVENLPRTKGRQSNIMKINCPMCRSMGESADTRFRCGIIRDGNGFGINCFNCKFKARYTIGGRLSGNIRNFFEQIGVTDKRMLEVNYMALLIQRRVNKIVESGEGNAPFAVQSYEAMSLPPGARPIKELAAEGFADDNFVAVNAYLKDRGEDLYETGTFFWSPDPRVKMNRRVIIPFYDFGNRVVGYTSRLIDKSREGRYYTKGPQSYLFNNQLLYQKDIDTIIVNEGPLDAIVDGGVAALGSSMNDYIVNLLNDSGKKIIIVPDVDKQGNHLIDYALTNNWYVAFPKLSGAFKDENWWDDDIKDPAEAAKRYGRLYTIRSILESATNSHFFINTKRKFLK